MPNPRKNQPPLPSEYQNLARVEDVSAIDEKVKNCYSQDRYEAFQAAVEKIVARYLKSVIGWAVGLWIASVILSMLAQKFFGII